MADTTQSILDLVRRFGGDIGLPKVDVDKFIESHRKNIEALSQSAGALSEGARAVAERNREILEAGFREATGMARDFRPLAAGADIMQKQADFARKAFDAAMQNTSDIAGLAKKSTSEAGRIFQDRLRESLNEIKANIDKSGGSGAAKK